MHDYRLQSNRSTHWSITDGAFVSRMVTVGEIRSMVIELLEYRAAPEAA